MSCCQVIEILKYTSKTKHLQPTNVLQRKFILYEFYLINDMVCVVGSLKVRAIISSFISYGPVIEKTGTFQMRLNWWAELELSCAWVNNNPINSKPSQAE